LCTRVLCVVAWVGWAVALMRKDRRRGSRGSEIAAQESEDLCSTSTVQTKPRSNLIDGDPYGLGCEDGNGPAW